MSSTGMGGSAPVGGGGILPGRPSPDSGPTVNPMLAEVAALAEWFGHPDNDIFDEMALTRFPVNLVNSDPATAIATLISLKPMAPLAFLGLFPSESSPQGLTHVLMFPHACPRILGAPSPFNTGLVAHSDEVTDSSSPTVGFPAVAFDPHNDATMVTIPDDPNGCFGALNNHSGSPLPLLASNTVDTKDANIPFMTWVPPRHAHLFFGHRLAPCAAAVAGITAVENKGVCTQA